MDFLVSILFNNNELTVEVRWNFIRQSKVIMTGES